jgi:two-component system, OmpR family, response regulator
MTRNDVRRLERILIVDDFPQMAQAVAETLRDLGYMVQTAKGGAEGLEIAKRFRPQLILLDIEMPKLNGYEVTRRIRRYTWGKRIVIIAFTALTSHEDRQRSLSAGCDDILVKPAALSEIGPLLGERWEVLCSQKKF